MSKKCATPVCLARVDENPFVIKDHQGIKEYCCVRCFLESISDSVREIQIKLNAAMAALKQK